MKRYLKIALGMVLLGRAVALAAEAHSTSVSSNGGSASSSATRRFP